MVRLLDLRSYDEVKYEMAIHALKVAVKGDNSYNMIQNRIKYGDNR